MYVYSYLSFLSRTICSVIVSDNVFHLFKTWCFCVLVLICVFVFVFVFFVEDDLFSDFSSHVLFVVCVFCVQTLFPTFVELFLLCV
jgi:hypothetical protein